MKKKKNEKTKSEEKKSNSETENTLTAREKEIIVMHMKGKSRKDIAREWAVAISTVDTHIKHIHLKTKTFDVLGVIKYGHDNHLDKV